MNIDPKLVAQWCEETPSCDIDPVEYIAQRAEYGRNAGLEAARLFFAANDTNLFWGSQAATHIEEFKEQK